MSCLRKNRAFTLIEVLVVVAIIALLVAVLVPSLTNARKQAQMVACQANLRSLMTAFLTYASETKGFLPGCSEDTDADWLGLGNRNKRTKTYPGNQPDDGTVFKYMGRDRDAYRCPNDDQYRDAAKTNTAYSYTSCTLLSGANVANIRGAHYRFAPGGTANFSETDHTKEMRTTVAFIVVEEDYQYFISGANNSAWDNDDGLTDRHPGKKGNVGAVDGHVQAYSLSPRPHIDGKFFGSRDQCVRYGKKWVSGRAWADDFASNPKGAYRGIEHCKPAKDYQVSHIGD